MRSVARTLKTTGAIDPDPDRDWTGWTWTATVTVTDEDDEVEVETLQIHAVRIDADGHTLEWTRTGCPDEAR